MKRPLGTWKHPFHLPLKKILKSEIAQKLQTSLKVYKYFSRTVQVAKPLQGKYYAHFTDTSPCSLSWNLGQLNKCNFMYHIANSFLLVSLKARAQAIIASR